MDPSDSTSATAPAEDQLDSAQVPEAEEEAEYDPIAAEREERAAAARLRLLSKKKPVGMFDPLLNNVCLNGTMKYGLLAGFLTAAHFSRKRHLVAAVRRGLGLTMIVGSVYFAQCKMRTELAEIDSKEQELEIWQAEFQKYQEEKRMAEAEQNLLTEAEDL